MTTECHLVGPLYEQVLHRLQKRIETGEWKSGVPLPSEVRLSHEFGVSVGTMRKALDLLVKQRVVSRKRGRGTFVKETHPRATGQTVVFRDLEGAALDVAIEVTHYDIGVATAEEKAALQLSNLESTQVLRIKREWRVLSRLVCLETIVVEAARVPDLSALLHSTGSTLHDQLAASHVAVDRTVWTIAPIGRADPEMQRADIDPSANCIRLIRLVFDEDDLALEWSRQTVIFTGQQLELVA